MDKALEILELQLDPEHKQFGKLLSIQATMTSSILSITGRVRSGDLRGQEDDGVDGLLAQLMVEEADGVEAPEVTEEDLFS